MKRVLTLALPAFVAASLLAGCGGAPAAAPSPSGSSSKQEISPSQVPSSKPTVTVQVTPKSTPVATGLKYSLSCSANGGPRTAITDYKDAWASPFTLCTIGSSAGTPTAVEKAAGTASGAKSLDSAKYLYALCATTAGHYFEGQVSSAQATEIAAALTLCPDHPQRAVLESSAGAGIAMDADRANGKLVYTGKYLVGKDVVPGTWESQGDKVENCYWEISDAQGNILSNNFISIAPKVTIAIPADAAGFTLSGCGFRWISE